MQGLATQIQSLQASRDSLVMDLQTIQELLREADAELERLTALRHSALIATLSDEPARPLNGFRVGVIGPSSREADYRKVIESLGATFAYAASEEKLGQIDRLCSKSDGVIFVTTFTSHKVEDQLTAAARRHGVPVQHLRFKGLERLREAALDLLPDMQSFKNRACAGD